MEAQSTDIIFKTIFVGMGAVGKTSICKRLDGLVWKPQYTTTIGMNLFNYAMNIGGKRVETIIYDTGGQQLFQTLNKFFYRGAVGAVIVYDITGRDSWNALSKWIDTIRKESGVVPLLIIGNKKDLDKDRVVDIAKTEQLLQKIRPTWVISDPNKSIFNTSIIPIQVVETSAKANESDIILIFEQFINQLYKITI